MIYLLCGEDAQAKDAKIAEIKNSILKGEQAVFFDFESIDSSSATAAVLKKALTAIPSFSSKRVVLIRHVEKLKNEAAGWLVNYADAPLEQSVLILEASGELKASLKDLTAKVKTTVLGVKPQLNVFDITDLIAARKTAEALKRLPEFYRQGHHPLQLIGTLVWYWGKKGRALGPVRFERGLKALEEADLNIKRSRLMPEYALEKLVVELVELQK